MCEDGVADRNKIPKNLTLHICSGCVQGVVISLIDNEGIIKSDEHGELPFDIKENFSDVEFTTEDINEEVEFTVVTVRFLSSSKAFYWFLRIS